MVLIISGMIITGNLSGARIADGITQTEEIVIRFWLIGSVLMGNGKNEG